VLSQEACTARFGEEEDVCCLGGTKRTRRTISRTRSVARAAARGQKKRLYQGILVEVEAPPDSRARKEEVRRSSFSASEGEKEEEEDEEEDPVFSRGGGGREGALDDAFSEVIPNPYDSWRWWPR
jgi:hypothetical protein